MYTQLLSRKLDALKGNGNYRYFLEVNRSAQHFPRFQYTGADGQSRTAVTWCSNDYLGMSTEEEVISRTAFVAHRSGAGSGGTRNISGTTNHHRELELTIANWHQQEAALLFNSAYNANITALMTLGRHIPELIFISDERNHASLIEGMRAAGNPRKIFRHNDHDHLETLLAAIPLAVPKIIVLESVYSIKGTVTDLRAIQKLAATYNALTYVDEVHAVGLYGQTGAGQIEAQGLRGKFDLVNGTLSKAIGCFGGYISGSALLIDFIRSFGPGFIFTTSLPPALCAAARKSIEILIREPERREQFHRQVADVRLSLQAHGIPFIPNESHITAIPVGDATLCKAVADRLLQHHGIYLQPINHPTVPVGEECLRLIITSRHLPKHINHLIYALQQCLVPATMIPA